MLTILCALRAEIEPLLDILPVREKKPLGHGMLYQSDHLDILRMGVGRSRVRHTLAQYDSLRRGQRFWLVGFAGSLEVTTPVGSVLQITKLYQESLRTPFVLSPYSTSLKTAAIVSVSSPLQGDDFLRKMFVHGKITLVDMEAHSVAEFCRQNSYELQIFKCVTDQANRQTPEVFKENYKKCARILWKELYPLLEREGVKIP